MDETNLNISIVQSIGRLTSLEFLSLQYCKLEGTFPDQVRSFSPCLDMTTLHGDHDVAFNTTSSSIAIVPTKRVVQFGTFEDSSYRGNHLLYGLPLPKSCDAKGSPSLVPKASTDIEEDNNFMEMDMDIDIFYISFTMSYIVVLLAIAIVLLEKFNSTASLDIFHASSDIMGRIYKGDLPLHFANYVRGGQFNQYYSGRFRGQNRGRGGRFNNSKPTCQLCEKLGTLQLCVIIGMTKPGILVKILEILVTNIVFGNNTHHLKVILLSKLITLKKFLIRLGTTA
ncbi:hypothetical protein Ddye_007869 [Dipteronia dyeriana]|uniref:Uncharacterized protein n=1 Tax=Dipteronia dyeriana TaxID=168575 RepID=A0AAD9XKM1_9ROSI|nr:hypothetical protein Ddye_007869 [Dipteronia dyeriana]